MNIRPIPFVLDLRELVRTINDRLRAINETQPGAAGEEFAGDMKGKRIVNLGRAVNSGDALNVALADERYARRGTGGNTTTVTGGGAVGQVTLSVPGTIAIGGDQAPRLSLPTPRTPIEVLVLLKQPGLGGSKVKVEIELLKPDNTRVSYMTAELAAGETSKSVVTGLGEIAAGYQLVLNLLLVCFDFPGADLTVQVRF